MLFVSATNLQILENLFPKFECELGMKENGKNKGKIIFVILINKRKLRN